jgi:hypothetical protein
MRKKLAFILIITILINTIVPRSNYAASIDDINKQTNLEDVQKHQNENGKSATEEAFEEGTASTYPDGGKNEGVKLGETASSSNTVAGVLGSIFIAFPYVINKIMVLIVNNFQDSGKEINMFTIEDLVMNKYKLFDINFFNINNNSSKNAVDIIRKNVAIWYISLRNIAIVASVIMLVYIGIRMLIANVAETKAKYQSMLMNWFVGLLLVFSMQYIFAFLLELQEQLLNIVQSVVGSSNADIMGFEEYLMEHTFEAFSKAKGWDTISYVITYFVFVFFQIKFFYTYLKRFLSVGFLIVVSPLVTITYSIDAAGDGVAQSFRGWMTNMIYFIFIQVIHATVYAIFIYSAGEIAKAIPLMGTVMIMALSRAEQIVKTTVKLNGSGSEIADVKLLDKIKKGPQGID